MVRLNTAALQNRLAREIGVSPGCIATPVKAGRTPSGLIRRRTRKVLGEDDSGDLLRLKDRHEQP